MSQPLSSYTHGFNSDTAKLKMFTYSQSTIDSCTSQNFEVVSPLRENVGFFGPLKFAIQRNSDYETPRIKLYSVIADFSVLGKKSMRFKFLQDIYLEYFSLFLDPAGSNLAQTLLNTLKFIWHCLFLLGVSAVFVNAEECSFQNRFVSIKP